MKVAVDFDDTLVKGIPFPRTDYELLDNAKEVICELADKGIEFILHTARYGWWRIPAILFIKKQRLPIKTLLFNKKPRAKLYIDDKNIFCNKIDWLEIKKEILKKYEELERKK